LTVGAGIRVLGFWADIDFVIAKRRRSDDFVVLEGMAL